MLFYDFVNMTLLLLIGFDYNIILITNTGIKTSALSFPLGICNAVRRRPSVIFLSIQFLSCDTLQNNPKYSKWGGQCVKIHHMLMQVLKYKALAAIPRHH